MHTNYDAGTEREALARELARWQTVGWLESSRAQRWHRRAQILTKVLRRPVAAVRAELAADAALLQDDEWPTTQEAPNRI